MDAADAGKTHPTVRYTLAGLEAGVLGALLMIGWAMISSLWVRRSIWTIPNLYATTFYGPGAYEDQFLRSSWSGVALIVAACGLGGILWSLLWRDRRRPFFAFVGGAAGVLAYYLFFTLILRYANPLIPLYAPERQMQIGFVLWGIALTRSQMYSRRIAACWA